MFRCGYRTTVAALVATVLASTSALAEESDRQWYGSLAALHDMPFDSGARLDHRRGSVAGDIRLSDALSLALALGVELRRGLSVEVEAALRATDLGGARGVTLNGAPVPGNVALTGDLTTMTLMANVRQSFGEGSFRPYVGVGAGLARHDGDAALSLASPLGSIMGRDSGHDTVIAFQAMAGIEGDPGEHITAFGGIRYLGTADLEIETFTSDYRTVSVDVGVRLRF